MKEIGYEKAFAQYSKGIQFNQGIGLYDTVENNEKFFIGDQWHGIDTGGNPAPVFNFLKRVTLFQVAKITSDNFSIQTSPMAVLPNKDEVKLEQVCGIVNRQFDALVEKNKLVSKNRQYVRNAAVDADACYYSYFDTDIETGQPAKGDIVTEIVENTRVLFGNPTERDVQRQPYIIITLRWEVDKAKRVAKANKQKADEIKADNDDNASGYDRLTDNKVTVLLYFAKDYETGTIWHGKYTKDGIIEPLKDTELKRYPIVWMNWDYVQDCYHGYALISQLIPNQVFVNRGYAMTMRSLMTSAFPKIIYDKNRLPYWDSGVGRAIGVLGGGDLNTIAKVIDPAPISPQVAQFLQLSMDETQSLMGASDTAMGDGRADNTSAIIALQRASDAPLELVRQNVYQALEDLAHIYLDMMRVYYGTRYVLTKTFTDNQMEMAPLGMQLPDKDVVVPFDFAELNDIPLAIKIDVGASSYWSEIAMTQTLDNLLVNNKIGFDDYLERIPNNRIAKRQELMQKVRSQQVQQMAQQAQMQAMAQAPEAGKIPVKGGGGYGELQRALNETGIV